MNKLVSLTLFSFLLVTNAFAVTERVNIANHEPINGRALEVGRVVDGRTYYVNLPANNQVTFERYRNEVMFVRLFDNGQYVRATIPHSNNIRVFIRQNENARPRLEVIA